MMGRESTDIAVAAKADAMIGESPIWRARHARLLWVDITGKQLHIYNPEDGTSEVVTTPSFIGFLAQDPSGDIVLGLEDGLARLGADGCIERFAGAPHADQTFRFNDENSMHMAGCGPGS